MQPYQKILIPSAISLVLIAISMLVQSHSYINHDVGWHLIVADRLLHGDHLYTDIIEINLPLVYYLRTIPVFIADLFGISPITTDTIHTNLLAIISLLLSYPFIHRHTSSLLPRILLLAATSIILFILPLCISASSIGQKEHLLIVLTLPYLFSGLYHDNVPPRIIRILIGLLAGIGFSLKPYFALLFIAMEGFLAVEKKSLIYWIRIETITTLLVALTYIGWVIIFFPAYFTDIIPLAKEAYLPHKEANMLSFLQQLLILFQPAAIPLLIICLRLILRKDRNYTFIFVLILASFAIVYSQMKGWDYHLLPAISFSLLITTYITNHLISVLESSKLKLRDGVDFLIALFMWASLSNLIVSGLDNNYHNTVANHDYEVSTITSLATEYKEKGPVYIIGKLPHSFPAINYASTSWPYRFSSLWIIDGAIYKRNNHLKEHFFTSLMDDLAKLPPALLIINQSAIIGHDEQQLPITYYKVMLENRDFQHFLTQYRQLPAKLSEKFIFFERIENKL